MPSTPSWIFEAWAISIWRKKICHVKYFVAKLPICSSFETIAHMVFLGWCLSDRWISLDSASISLLCRSSVCAAYMRRGQHRILPVRRKKSRPIYHSTSDVLSHKTLHRLEKGSKGVHGEQREKEYQWPHLYGLSRQVIVPHDDAKSATLSLLFLATFRCCRHLSWA